jgi:hypothetical protein
VVDAVLPSLFAELARAALPLVVALVGVGGSLWLFGRSRGAAALLFLGMGTVALALLVDLLAFPTLNGLAASGVLEVGAIGYRVLGALTNFAEGLGLAATALAGVVGAGLPEEDE